MNTPEWEEKKKISKGRPRKSLEVAKNPRTLKMTKEEKTDMEENPIYPAQFSKMKE